MTLKRLHNMEWLNNEIDLLQIYLDTKCPPNKVKIVRQSIKFYLKRLARL